MRRLAAESGTVERLIHFSDMGADLKHGSRRMRTKAQGDADLMRIFPDATIMKCVRVHYSLIPELSGESPGYCLICLVFLKRRFCSYKLHLPPGCSYKLQLPPGCTDPP